MDKDILIFLDFDGVINTIVMSKFPEPGFRYHKEDRTYYDICSSSNLRVSNKNAVAVLSNLCQDFNARIVVSSVWRRHKEHNYQAVLEKMRTCLYNSGLDKDIIVEGLTPVMDDLQRGDEILAYINKHYPEGVDAFCILDDDMDMNGCMDKLIKCDTYHGFGLTESHKAEKLIKEQLENK